MAGDVVHDTPILRPSFGIRFATPRRSAWLAKSASCGRRLQALSEGVGSPLGAGGGGHVVGLSAAVVDTIPRHGHILCESAGSDCPAPSPYTTESRRRRAMSARPMLCASSGDDRREHDVLSDVLRAVRLTGAVYFDFELSSPWAVDAPPSREIAAIVMPGAQRVIEYHLSPAAPVGHTRSARSRFGCARATSSCSRRATRTSSRARRDARRRRDLSVFARPRRRCRSSYELAAAAPSGRASSAASWAATSVRTTRCSRRCRA